MCMCLCVWHRAGVVSFVLLWLYMFVWRLAAVWSRPLARLIPVMRFKDLVSGKLTESDEPDLSAYFLRQPHGNGTLSVYSLSMRLFAYTARQ